jgi:hypothetical protein
MQASAWTAFSVLVCSLGCGTSSGDGGTSSQHDTASSQQPSAGSSGDPDAGACEGKSASFDAFVADHESCANDDDCRVIGDCGPNADFVSVRADAADEAYRLMQARCVGTYDGPIYDAVCTAGRCDMVQNPTDCCGCAPGQDAGR